jgi:hypothetical protein
VSSFRAVLTFPWRSGDASRALAGRASAGLAPLVPAALAMVYLLARGAQAADAAWSGVAVLLVVLGLGLGGCVGAFPARLLLARPYRISETLGPCLVFAAWTPPLFVAVLLLARALGAEETAALYSGFTLLIWGVVCGMGVIGGDEAEDYGRAVVATCIGLALSLAGLMAALLLVQAQLVLAVPAMTDTDEFAAGDRVLVRREAEAAPGSCILLLEEGSREAMFAVAGPGGAWTPLSANAEKAPRGRWHVAGRVFFRLGGPWGGTALRWR